MFQSSKRFLKTTLFVELFKTGLLHCGAIVYDRYASHVDCC